MKYQTHRFSITGTSAPPNPFFALKCSTSDPAKVKLLPLACGTRDALSPSGLPLKQSSACANRAPLPPLQPVTPDVPAMFAREGDSPGLEIESLPLGRYRQRQHKQDAFVGSMPTETNCATAPIMPELATRKFNSGSGGRFPFEEVFRCGWDASIADRSRMVAGYPTSKLAMGGWQTAEGRKRSRPPQMDISSNGIGRPPDDDR